MTLTGGVDSMLGIESKKFINSPLVRADFDGTLHRLSTIVNIFKCIKSFFTSTLQLKLWQIFLLYKTKLEPLTLKDACMHAWLHLSMLKVIISYM